jgi:hypothetical protein
LQTGVHTPATHVALPFATLGHAEHELPQLFTEVLSKHAPLQA